MLKLYLSGDLQALTQELNRHMMKDDPLSRKFYRLLLTERETRMADRIEVSLKQNPEKSFFFAIGVAHLREGDGIPDLLSKKGFTVNRVSVDR